MWWLQWSHYWGNPSEATFVMANFSWIIVRTEPWAIPSSFTITSTVVRRSLIIRSSTTRAFASVTNVVVRPPPNPLSTMVLSEIHWSSGQPAWTTVRCHHNIRLTLHGSLYPFPFVDEEFDNWYLLDLLTCAGFSTILAYILFCCVVLYHYHLTKVSLSVSRSWM